MHEREGEIDIEKVVVYDGACVDVSVFVKELVCDCIGEEVGVCDVTGEYDIVGEQDSDEVKVVDAEGMNVDVQDADGCIVLDEVPVGVRVCVTVADGVEELTRVCV